MSKIYIDTTKRSFFDENGLPLPDGFPVLSYKKEEKIQFQLCTESPGAGTEGAKPETWRKDTSFASAGTTALLSADKDFIRRHKGELKQDYQAGGDRLTVAITGATRTDIPPSGTVRLYDNTGVVEAVGYSEVLTNGKLLVFVLAAPAAKDYSAGAFLDVPDELYAQAAMEPNSDPANGLFAFSLFVYSPKLRGAMEYQNIKTLSSLAGLELLIFSTDGQNTTLLDNFLCTTVSLQATMAEANPNPQIPDAEADRLVALISAEVQRQLQGYAPGGSGGSNNAADIIISAESQFYAGMDIEAALQQIGAELDGLEAELEGI